MDELEIRPLEDLEDLRAAARLCDEVWGQRRVVGAELLRALTKYGNPVLGAFDGGEMVGAQMGFFGTRDGETVLHSHVTGIRSDHRHAGVGAAMKWSQRDWALAHGIETVTWTFDPMMARNAYLNLRKLAARAERFHRDFYGALDDAMNSGERTDRLEIVWRLRDPAVEAAARGERPAPPEGAVLVLRDDGGRPLPMDAEDDVVAIASPADFVALRERDLGLARAWREAVADALERSLARGYAAVDFLRDGAYVLERT